MDWLLGISLRKLWSKREDIPVETIASLSDMNI